MAHLSDSHLSNGGLLQGLKSSDKFKKLTSLADDITVLKSIWFSKAKGGDHASRLEQFYAPQAHAYDKFRANFLHGRKPMLAACAARLADVPDLIWVDLGGGTGANVEMMSQYLPLSSFKSIYVVDLCGSLCEQARKKVIENKWTNVKVCEGDACTFAPPEGKATLVTFSYSLSMIPPFHSAVDQALSYLDSADGLIGVADFYVPSRYDLPLRQMSWLRRFFWRSTFDIDNIDIGPERRHYLDHCLSRVWEMNAEGHIPYVPYLRAPFYVWVGRVRQVTSTAAESKVEAPPTFPPTFLYTMSWEDPRPDMEVLKINDKDTVLTLTSGGCNALNLLLHGAGQVVSVDCNPAQSALLELKAAAIRQLSFEDTWLMFGEGRHPQIRRLFEAKLAPFLSEASLKFWKTRLWYFERGLYYQGGMGSVCWAIQTLCNALGLGKSLERIATAHTLSEQRTAWEESWLVKFCKSGPTWLVDWFTKVLASLFFNRFVLWFGAGVPCKQYQLILNDGLKMSTYAARVMDGVAKNSHLRKDNYFYYNCALGKYSRDNCPSYLVEENFNRLKASLIDKLVIVTGTFVDQLKSRTYTKVILMDHVDWQDVGQARDLAASLAKHVAPGGRIIWRSAALVPPYARIVRDAGFDVRCISRADEGYMDRVNMYSSFYVATRRSPVSE
eukprot:jgi/Botrbrau1/11486/Bobra.0360s0013.1